MKLEFDFSKIGAILNKDDIEVIESIFQYLTKDDLLNIIKGNSIMVDIPCKFPEGAKGYFGSSE